MLKALFYITLVSLSLGQFTALSKSEGTNIYLFDILVAGTTVVNVFYLLVVSKKFKVPRAFVYLITFLLVGVLSLFINSWKLDSAQLVSAGFYAVRFLVYSLFGLSLYNLVLVKKLTLNEIYKAFVISGILITILGFVQLVLLPDFEQLNPLLGWDPHKNRLASTFFDPNFVGAYLVITLTIFILKLSQKNISSFLVISLLLAGIVLTFSRSAWLMLAAVIFMYGVFKNPKILLVSLVVAFMAYYTTPRIQTRISGTTDPADSAAFRYISWSNTAKIIKDNSIFGVGFNALRNTQLEYGFVDPDTVYGHSVAGSDASLLFVWATSGLVGLILFIRGFFDPLFRKRDAAKNIELYQFIIFPLLLESVFINSLFYPQLMVLWISCLAFSYVQK